MDSSAPSAYTFRPLETERSIRLMVLQPGTPHDRLSCQIEHHCLDDNLTYEALLRLGSSGTRIRPADRREHPSDQGELAGCTAANKITYKTTDTVDR